MTGTLKVKHKSRSPQKTLTDQLKRREFITLLCGAAAWPIAARAQSVGQMRRVGIVMPYPKGDAEWEVRAGALRQELAKLGWTEGSNIQFDERWTTDDMSRVRADAGSLMASNPDVVVATRRPGGPCIDAALSLHPDRRSGGERSSRRRLGVKPRAARRQRHRLYEPGTVDIRQVARDIETDRARRPSRCLHLQSG